MVSPYKKIDWNFLEGAYRQGYFPMADSHDDLRVHWIAPEVRCLIPIHNFIIPRSLKKFHKRIQNLWRVGFDENTAEIIAECAKITEKRPTGWINQPILEAFQHGAGLGRVHSVAVYDEHGALIGGLYGLAQGSVFNGESMFSRAPNASKIALIYLVAHLANQGFQLLDAQFRNPHLDQFRPYYLSYDEYLSALKTALATDCSF